MITYKTPEDFKKMEAAGKVVSNIHYEIYDKTKAGMTLIDLDDIAKNIISKNNNIEFTNFESISKQLTILSVEESLLLIKENLNNLGINHDNFSSERSLVENNEVEKVIDKLKSNQPVQIEDFNFDIQLLEKINKFAPIKHILKNKPNNENQVIELLDDISKDLFNYDLEFRIQELESKFSEDMSETTFNELKELKNERKIN